jgi:hypothetical protein
MPRKLPVEYPGAIYHVINRGDRHEDIFRDDADRTRFLETLGQACGKTGWHVLAYCLIPNHFHLVVERPRQSLWIGSIRNRPGKSPAPHRAGTQTIGLEGGGLAPSAQRGAGGLDPDTDTCFVSRMRKRDMLFFGSLQPEAKDSGRDTRAPL